MAFRIIDPKEDETRIKVVGVGGAGGSAVDLMARSRLYGVELLAIDTDARALGARTCGAAVCIGERGVTHGLGTGSQSALARQAVEEDRARVAEELPDSGLVLIVAGMGGGTGTGAAPVVAQIARQRGALTLGVVTMPFLREGPPRRRAALTGSAELQEHVDSLILVESQHLLSGSSRGVTVQEGFRRADEVLLQAARGICDLVAVPGMLCFSFRDVRTIFEKGGRVALGVGQHQGEDRARQAAGRAIESPLLGGFRTERAKRVLVNITAGTSLTLNETHEAVAVICDAVEQEANTVCNTVLDDRLVDEVRITVYLSAEEGSPR